MEILQQISELLPISAPFFIERMEKDDSEQVVHIYLSVSKQARPSSDYHIHSHYSRTWEHLRLFQYRTFIHCDLPVYRHKNKPKDLQKAVVSFARDHARFTLLYEQEVLRLMGLHHCISTASPTIRCFTPTDCPDLSRLHRRKLPPTYYCPLPLLLGCRPTSPKLRLPLINGTSSNYSINISMTWEQKPKPFNNSSPVF
jgi:hypothetical protein